MSDTGKRLWIRAALIAGLLLWIADFAYKTTRDISVVDRERCVLYRSLPAPGFLAFEYFFETVVLVFLGTFAAVLLGRWFLRYRRFYPNNPVTAFLSGALVPVCACAAIPLMMSMKGKMRFTTTLSFVLAAPLLSPYILVLSFTVLGFRYGVLRVVSSFLVVMISAGVLGLMNRRAAAGAAVMAGCDRSCAAPEGDVYLGTWTVFRRLLPFLAIAGALGIALEMAGPRSLLLAAETDRGLGGVLFWIAVGVPLYFCNGAEVLFLRPLMTHGLPIGTGIAFSLTSTAICTTSIAMLGKVIGGRLTAALVLCVAAVSAGLALVWNGLM